MCNIPLMPKAITPIAPAALLPVWASVFQADAVYEWMHIDGVLHCTDTAPAEIADAEKQISDVLGVTAGVARAKKTPRKIVEEIIEEDLRQAKPARETEKHRPDSASLVTYQTVDEIIMHRECRIELLGARPASRS